MTKSNDVRTSARSSRRPSGQKKRKAFRLGLQAETQAAWLLRLKGYRILGHRVRTVSGEIDLIAKRGQTLAIVEVKARSHQTDALQAVTPALQRRLTRAAGVWLAAHPRYASASIRYDIVAIAPRRLPLHLANAFEAREV